jgi:uncharacterized coiled-coil protein SlyX
MAGLFNQRVKDLEGMVSRRDKVIAELESQLDQLRERNSRLYLAAKSLVENAPEVGLFEVFVLPEDFIRLKEEALQEGKENAKT